MHTLPQLLEEAQAHTFLSARGEDQTHASLQIPVGATPTPPLSLDDVAKTTPSLHFKEEAKPTPPLEPTEGAILCLFRIPPHLLFPFSLKRSLSNNYIWVLFFP